MKFDIHPVRWIRKNHRRLDTSLRHHLIEKMQFLRRTPCVLQPLVAKSYFRFSRVPIIAEFEPAVRTQSEAIMSQWRLENIEVQRHFTHFPGCALRLPLHKLNQILEQNIVSKVYLDREITTMLDVASPTVRSPQLWSEDVTGKDIGIAIIDTGVAPHPDLTEPNNRIIAFHDLVGSEIDPYDDNGHGTHCAGDAAGNGTSSEGVYRGPAPEADIIGVKVMNKFGSGMLSDLIAGVEWCIENREKYNIRILSMSLGSQATGKVENDPLARTVREAWTNGLVVVAAAGNAGPDPETISSPGIVPEILTIGASDDKNTVERTDDEVADFSSRGPTPEEVTKPDVVAPGTDIVSLRVKGSYLDKMAGGSAVNDSYISLSGTSMATPIVAGIAAQLLQADPTLTPEQVKQLITDTAQSLGEEPNTEGHGLVDAFAACEALKSHSR